MRRVDFGHSYEVMAVCMIVCHIRCMSANVMQDDTSVCEAVDLRLDLVSVESCLDRELHKL